MTHTPGPWIAYIGEDARWFVREVRKIGNVIARLWADPQSEANAKLMAAAPDMLAALRKWETWYGTWPRGCNIELEDVVDATVDAIAKATNTQQPTNTGGK